MSYNNIVEGWKVQDERFKRMQAQIDEKEKEIKRLNQELNAEIATSNKLKAQLELALRLLDSMSGR